MTQSEFWRREVERQPLFLRLSFIESHFQGSYGCGWEEGTFYPLPEDDARILQALWEETYQSLHHNCPDSGLMLQRRLQP